MPEIRFQAGASVFVPDKDDIADATQRGIEAARQWERARGFKWMRLPEVLSGTASGSAITLGVSQGQPVVGPEQGLIWSLRRLIVTGLTAGSTPDVINLYRNDRFAGPPLWQFNGNNFGYTFGRMELVLMGGDTLGMKSVGTFAATGTITLSGELVEVPAERMHEII